jgi:hypothetical protein
MGKQKSRVVRGMIIMLIFIKNSPGEKGSVQCIVDATASSFVTKVLGEVFAHIFM